jgi:hypothetical protein
MHANYTRHTLLLSAYTYAVLTSSCMQLYTAIHTVLRPWRTQRLTLLLIDLILHGSMFTSRLSYTAPFYTPTCWACQIVVWSQGTTEKFPATPTITHIVYTWSCTNFCSHCADLYIAYSGGTVHRAPKPTPLECWTAMSRFGQPRGYRCSRKQSLSPLRVG